MFQEIEDGLWHDTHDLSMSGGIQFRTRSTLVRLGDNTLWMHSPIPIDDERAETIAALGEVSHIVAPNGFHDSFACAAKQRYPHAQLWASPALKDAKSRLLSDAYLGDGHPSWAGELETLLIEGSPQFSEFVFFHHASKTVITTDLLFQICYPVNLRTKAVLWMAGASGGRLAQSRLWRPATRDRAAAGRSVRQMLRWDFERLVLAHGDFVEGADTKQRVREALFWMLDTT